MFYFVCKYFFRVFVTSKVFMAIDGSWAIIFANLRLVVPLIASNSCFSDFSVNYFLVQTMVTCYWLQSW